MMYVARIVRVMVILMALFSNSEGREVVFRDTPEHLERIVQRLARSALSTENLKDSIESVLIDNGYFDATVQGDKLRLIIDAGQRFQLEQVVDDADSTVFEIVDEPFTVQNLDRAMARLLRRQQDVGHFFCRATITRFDRNDRKVRAIVNLNRGPLVTIGDVRLAGLNRTDPDLVRRHLVDVNGSALTQSTIDHIEADAQAIGFLDFQPPPAILPRSGHQQADIELMFRERRQVHFEGGIGYLPNDPDGLTWSFFVRSENLFGGGRTAAVRSNRYEKGRNVLAVDYRQPLFLFGTGSLGLGVSTRDFRDQFSEFTLHTDIETRLSRGLSWGLFAGWRSVEPAVGIPSYRVISGGLEISRRLTRNRLNPRSGLTLNWRLAYTHRAYSSDSTNTGSRGTYDETRVAAAIDLYRPLPGSIVGHFGLKWKSLETNEELPPLSEMVFLGGPASLRGFRRDRFAGLRAAVVTAETRLRFEQGYGFLFYDGAYLFNRRDRGDAVIVIDETYHNGYGMGLMLSDGNRAVKLSLAWNPELSYDEPWLSVELSAGI